MGEGGGKGKTAADNTSFAVLNAATGNCTDRAPTIGKRSRDFWTGKTLGKDLNLRKVQEKKEITQEKHLDIQSTESVSWRRIQQHHVVFALHLGP